MSIGNEREEAWSDKCWVTAGDVFVAENEES